MEQPLVVVNDGQIVEVVGRIAAAAGVEIEVTADLPSRVRWLAAPAVVIDAQLVDRAVRAGLPRRPSVVAVAAGPLDGSDWSSCVRLGVERTVPLADCDGVLVEMLSDAVDPDPGGGRCLAVVGACGGAGASVFAIALAATAGRVGESDALLVDCDPWGAGADATLGIEDGLRWPDLATSGGRLAPDALRSGLPSVKVGGGRLIVLCPGRGGGSGPTPDAMEVVLESARRGGTLAVVDLPRQPGDVADRVLERADLVVLVVPADLRSCLAGRKIRDRVEALGGRMGAVVRGPCPSGIGPDDVAAALAVPVLARMRGRPALARDLDHGRIPGIDRRDPLARAAAAVLAADAGPGRRRRTERSGDRRGVVRG